MAAWRRRAVVVLALAVLAALRPGAAQPDAPPSKAVLVLHTLSPGFPVSDSVHVGVRQQMHEAGLPASSLYIEYLDLLRRGSPDQRQALVEMLQRRVAGVPVAVIVAEGDGAVDFLAADAHALLPTVPVVTAVTQRVYAPGSLGARPVEQVTVGFDSAGSLALIAQAIPKARRLLVVNGSSTRDAQYAADVRRHTAGWTNRFAIEFTDGQPLPALRARLAALGPGDVVLYSTYFGDRDGRTHVPAEVVAEVVRVANAPVFAMNENYLALGSIGGRMLRVDAYGKNAGRAVLAVLRGQAAFAPTPAPMPADAVYTVFDWRGLERWGIDPGRLPAGTVFVNRPPPLWDSYRRETLAVGAAFTVLSLLLLSLALMHRRRRAAERALEAGEQRYRLLVETAPEAIVVVDTDAPGGRFVEANPRAQELFGGTLETLRERPLVGFYPPTSLDGRPTLEAMREAASSAAAGRSVSFERIVVRPDGSERCCEVRLVPLPDAQRTLVRATFTDITERKAIESALSIVAQRGGHAETRAGTLDKLMQGLGELLQVDVALIAHPLGDGQAETVALAVDHRAQAPHRFSTAGTVCAPFSRDDEPVRVVVGDEEGAGREALWPGLAVNGCAAAPLWNAQGEFIGCVAVAHRGSLPLPERTRAVLQIVAGRAAQEVEGLQQDENALQQQALLERQVAARTADLERANEDLARARDAAEAATRAKSAFLANMSHEVRTPMNGILGMVGLALRSDPTPRQAEYLRKTRSAAESLLGLLNDILDFSKIEAGKLELEHEPFRLDEVLERVVSIVSVPAQAKGLALSVDAEPGLPPVLVGDALRLNQILVNLCGNAVKFTAAGSVALQVERVGHAARPGGGVMLRFAVRDTGIGMSEAETAQLFHAFSQADSSHARRFGGTGLGLAICKQLVTMMGGEIGVASRPGAGSEFAFSVPFDLPPETVPLRTDIPADAASATDAAALRGMRVLLVEDNEINQEIARELLTQEVGVDVTVAANGREALQALRAHPFDAVLMDLQMPEMDGYEATRRIRAEPAWRELPIIAMTAHAMVQDQARCLDAGMNDHVAKPMDFAELCRALVRWRREHAAGPNGPR